jgi:hypothetical protein
MDQSPNRLLSKKHAKEFGYESIYPPAYAPSMSSSNA